MLDGDCDGDLVMWSRYGLLGGGGSAFPLCAGGGLFCPCVVSLSAVNHDVVVGTLLDELNKFMLGE